MNKKLTAVVLSGAVVWLMGAHALAAQPAGQSDIIPISAPVEDIAMTDSALYYGTVSAISTEEDGTISRLTMESEAHGQYVMNLSPDTVWVDAGNKTAADPSTVKVGDRLYLYHSHVSTRSLPPQSAAFAVVVNVPQDMGAPHYHVVNNVVSQEDGSVKFSVDNGGLILSVSVDAGLSAYEGDAPALADIQAGDRIMAWYDIVLTSYPGQSGASHIMLLPAKAEDLPKPEEGAQLTMELDGKVPNMVGRYESGVAMVPVAAVAQALGLDVTYTPNTDEGALVTVESDQFRVSLYLDRQIITGVTKIEGAVGATGPLDYGKAPYVVAPGTTWAPAEIFKMLGRTVTLEGTNLIIE